MKKMLKKWAGIPIKEKIFQIVNLVVVIAIIATYFYRMVYFKEKVIREINEKTNTTLHSVVTSLTNIDLNKDDRLYANQDGSYYFKGNVENNYLKYSGAIYRIVSVDSYGNVKIIAQDSVGVSVLDEKDSFENTGLYDWLNLSDQKATGIYENSLRDRTANLVKVTGSNATINDLNNISDSSFEADVTILSVKEYIAAGGNNSYLNNGQSFWLSNQDDSGKYYFVDQQGELALSYSDSLMLNVRPVLNIGYTVEVKSGDGTKDNPYIIVNENTTTVSNIYSGKYISYSNYLWRVQYNDADGNLILSMSDYIKVDDEIYTRDFGSTNQIETMHGVGKYLNKEFIKQLDDYKDYLVEKQWDFGLYNVADHNYLNNYQSTVKMYVSLPHAGYMYLNDFDNIFFMTSSLNSDKTIYGYKDSLLYEYTKTDEAALIPVICLSSKVQIASGEGTIDNPYTLRLPENE